MKKAIMIPIQPKWSKMIKNGLKKFEFRNYAIPKGTKVYIYESLGKSKPKHLWESFPLYIGFDTFEGKYADNVFEGWGKVVAEFVVVRCYDLSQGKDAYEFLAQGKENIEEAEDILSPKEATEIGYNGQKYAIEITDLIVYDEEWMLERRKLFPKNIHDISSNDWELGQKMGDAPTKPLDISEFVGWNKLTKYKNDINRLERKTGNVGYLIEDEKQAYEIGKSWERVDENKHQNLKWDMYLTHAPQGKVYVVEREVK